MDNAGSDHYGQTQVPPWVGAQPQTSTVSTVSGQSAHPWLDPPHRNGLRSSIHDKAVRGGPWGHHGIPGESLGDPRGSAGCPRGDPPLLSQDPRGVSDDGSFR